MKVSLIITLFNKWELTHNRIFEITQKLDMKDLEIVLADDGSTDADVYKGIHWWKERLSNLRHIRSLQPTSFAENVNRAVQASTGDIIVITQNDVIFDGNFIRPIVQTIKDDYQLILGAEYLDRDTGWNRHNGIVVPYIPGWLIACHSITWSLLGGFDENITPYDAEDIEFCIRAVENGYYLRKIDLPVRHISGQTILYSEEREAITKKNLEYVWNKWGDKLRKIYDVE